MNTGAEQHREALAFPVITFRELARKYEALWSLRQAGASFDKAQVRAISTEFPGALRELDVLSDEQLMARLTHARAACQGETPEAWLIWLLAYHSEMRVVLELQRQLGRLRSSRRALGLSSRPRRMLEEQTVEQHMLEEQTVEQHMLEEQTVEQDMLEELAAHGVACSPERLHSLLSPPGGRLNNVVFGWLAERFGVNAARLEQALFPRLASGKHERG